MNKEFSKRLLDFQKKIDKQTARQRRHAVYSLLVLGIAGYFFFKNGEENNHQLVDKFDSLNGSLDKNFDTVLLKIDEHSKGVDELSIKLSQLDEKVNKLHLETKKINMDIKSPYKAKSKNVQLAYALIERGFTKEQAAAIVGNMDAESSLNPKATDGRAIGLMQWQDGRLTTLKKFATKKGKHYHDLNVQLDYVAWELGGGNKKETSNFKKAQKLGRGDIKQFSYNFAKHVERPAFWALQQSKERRMNVAYNTYNTLQKEIG